MLARNCSFPLMNSLPSEKGSCDSEPGLRHLPQATTSGRCSYKTAIRSFPNGNSGTTFRASTSPAGSISAPASRGSFDCVAFTRPFGWMSKEARSTILALPSKNVITMRFMLLPNETKDPYAFAYVLLRARADGNSNGKSGKTPTCPSSSDKK
jgi:hypothetical protein